MKKDNKVLLAVAISITAMILIFTVLLIYMANHFTKAASDAEHGEAASLTPYADTQADYEENSELPEDISPKIYTEEDVDMAVDDTAIHDVEYESEYVNTVEYVPSIRGERAIVYSQDVSQSNFTKSSIGDELYFFTIQPQGTGNGQETQISVPRQIHLYNVENEESNTYELNVDIKGDKSLIKSIGWNTSDSEILELSGSSGKSVAVRCISGHVGESTLNIVITYYTGAETTVSEEFAIAVDISDMDDDTTILYDKGGQVLYLDKAGEKEAHLCDYGSEAQFYGAQITTGWQTIDGKTYYFTAKGWPVSGMQIIGGRRYSFDEDGVLMASANEKGIDVSRYQKDIDWQAVAQDGVTYAIIRCGFRGSVSGQLVEDSYFRKNIEGAKKAGIKVGVYFFTQAVTEKEAREEAAMAVTLCRDYAPELPVFIDSEAAVGGRANSLSKSARTDILKAFCDEVTKGGCQAGVYASKYWYYDNLEASELEQYSIWVAQYNTVCDYKGKMDYWQYSSREQISGITGNVDVNMSY